VNRAVNLNDDSGFSAEEIGNVRFDRMLPTKAPSSDSMTSQHCPESLLGGSCLSTLISRCFAQPDLM
jgi:hypothetical protein